MKRIVSMIIAVLFLVTNSLAYTNQISAKGLGMVITSKPGNEVTIIPKTEDILGWEVEEGNIEVVDNKFTTPEENVVISAIEKAEYLLTVVFPYFTNEEMREAGESITIEALAESEGYVFKNWEVEGLTITEEESLNSSLTITMPENAVTITANYEEVELPSIDNIPLGSYIQYVPSNTTVTVLGEDSGYTSDGTESGAYVNQTYYPQTYTEGWKVFANNDGKLDIISAENVLTDSSATETTLTLQGATGYANAVYTLNSLSEGYINPEYAIDGRSLGSVKGSSIDRIDTTEYPLTHGSSGSIYRDELYAADKTIIDTEIDGGYPLRHSEGTIWCSSRGSKIDSSFCTDFWVYSLKSDGQINGVDTLYGANSSSMGGGSNTLSKAYGVRPIISLREGMVVTGGSGTVDDPYILSITASTPEIYTVTFNANGGSGNMNGQIFTEGIAQNLKSNAFIKVGYDFAGWTTDTSEDSIEYGDGESYTATGNTTLYAVWAPSECTVTITGHASYNMAYLTINGTQYNTGNTLTFEVGTLIECYSVNNSDTSLITYNGVSVGEKSDDWVWTYSFYLSEDITVQLDYSSGSDCGYVTITSN